ncbi:MAG: trypsin-like peptidase domain-containing protein [Solobacterium sp.]|nr:trypsin-like peptidase domain-containing protein [Solobacterium sp.]
MSEEIKNEEIQTRKSWHPALNALLCAVLGLGGGYTGGRIAVHTQKTDGTVQESTEPTVVYTPVQTTVYAEGEELSIGQIVDKAADSVVEIRTTVKQTGFGFYGSYTTEGAGSGVIITSDGYIVTNNHVIRNAESIAVRTTDGTEYEASLIGTDEKSDIAVIKVDASGLKPAEIGDSSLIHVGDTAVVIGNPLGTLGGTVTNGIISALDRQLIINNQALNLIQTNAAINSGNSGGGLFNGQGQVIGIVNAKDSGATSSGALIEGLGFAIPINDAMDIASQLMESGHVTDRATLGVSLTTVPYDYRGTKAGLYINSVFEGSGAEEAGLKADDRITAADGQPIVQYADLSFILQKKKIGDTILITVERDGQEVTCRVTLTAPIYYNN